MSIFNNIKNINNIYHNDKEIVAVYANNKLVYSNSKIEYNYFVFNVPAETTIYLKTVSGNNVLEWDRVTNWGDGSSDKETWHYYKEAGTYKVKTKHVINGTHYLDGNEATRKALIKCSIGCTDRLKYLFYGCSMLKEVDLTPLSKIKDLSFVGMDHMFYECYSLTSIKLPTSISVSGSLSCAFTSCQSLNSIDLTYINFDSINDTSSMFSGCIKLTSLNLSGFNMQYVTSYSYMFSNCTILSYDNIIKTGCNQYTLDKLYDAYHS